MWAPDVAQRTEQSPGIRRDGCTAGEVSRGHGVCVCVYVCMCACVSGVWSVEKESSSGWAPLKM